MQRWDKIIQMPVTQYERFYMMIRLLNDLNDDYSGDLFIPDETGVIHINEAADNGRLAAGYSRWIIVMNRDGPRSSDRSSQALHQEHNDLRLAQVAMGRRFNRLSETDRIVMIQKHFRFKGKDKLPELDLSDRQIQRIQRHAEYHLIVEWGLNIFDSDGFQRGEEVVRVDDAFILEGRIDEDKELLGEPRRMRGT